MYEPQKRSKYYLLFIAAIASIIGWAIFVQYRPYIIKTSCSEIAAGTSNLLPGKKYDIQEVSAYTYDNVKTDCLKDASR